MVVGKEVVYHDVWCGTGNEMGQVQGMPARYKADRKLLSAALSVTSDIALCEGLICSGGSVYYRPGSFGRYKREFPGGWPSIWKAERSHRCVICMRRLF